MALGILVLRRALSIPKSIWRLSATPRTLCPLPVDRLILDCWQEYSPGLLEQNAFIELQLTATGERVGPPGVRTVKQRDWVRLFDFEFETEEVKVVLKEEGCRKEVYTPRRTTRQIAQLKAWKPVRVLLNGKADWHDGRFYYLQDYHLVLCSGPAPSSLPEVRLIDLQEDI